MESLKIIFQQIMSNIQAAIEALKNSSFYASDFVQSNAFNFVVVVLLLAIVLKLAKVGQTLENAKQKIKETIDKSTETKENSIKELLQAGEIAKNTPTEILEIENNNKKSIELLKQKIENETSKELEDIEQNTKKIISMQNEETVSSISKKTAQIALEIAKNHIKQILKQKPDYHEQFIEKSIQELEAGLK